MEDLGNVLGNTNVRKKRATDWNDFLMYFRGTFGKADWTPFFYTPDAETKTNFTVYEIGMWSYDGLQNYVVIAKENVSMNAFAYSIDCVNTYTSTFSQSDILLSLTDETNLGFNFATPLLRKTPDNVILDAPGLFFVWGFYAPEEKTVLLDFAGNKIKDLCLVHVKNKLWVGVEY